MRKFITYILAFFVVIIVIDQVVGITGDYMQHHCKPGEVRQLDNFISSDTHELIVMGSSRAHHHYVPKILSDSLSLDAYNIGVDGNGIILAYGILQMILERYTPEVIIYDIMPVYDLFELASDDNRKRYLKDLKPYFHHRRIQEIIKDISPMTYIECFSGLYRYNTSITTLLMQNLSASSFHEDGYSPSKGELQENDRYDYVEDCSEKIDSVKIKYLSKFIELCQDNNIKLFLMVSPKVADRPVGMKKELEIISRKHNIKIYDFYDDSDFVNNLSLFKDHDHLNYIGAELYTKKVVDSIKNYHTVQ